MTRPSNPNPRLAFLSRVVGKQCRHLLATDQRPFDQPFSAARAGQLEANPDLAERVDAFVGRFDRLPDNAGDKLLPARLAALGEMPGPAIDNLDRAERFGWVDSADTWKAMRRLHSQMIHEYVEDPALLSSAPETAHRYVPRLIASAERLANEVQGRGWV